MRFYGILIGMLALLSAGCGRVTTIHYVQGVEFDPAVARGLPLDQVYVVDDVMKLKGGNILVKLEDPRKTIDRSTSKIGKLPDEKDNWNKLRAYFEFKFMYALKKSKEFKDVQRETYALSSFKPDAVLTVAITQWHEGNKVLRALIGLGLGATRVQYEGVLTDARTHKILFAFADARIHPGGPSVLGLPLKVWRGGDLITEDLGWGADEVAKTLKIVIETPAEGAEEAPAAPQPPAVPLPAVPITKE